METHKVRKMSQTLQAIVFLVIWFNRTDTVVCLEEFHIAEMWITWSWFPSLNRQQHVQMPNNSRAGSIYASIAGSYSIERANNAICGENVTPCTCPSEDKPKKRVMQPRIQANESGPARSNICCNCLFPLSWYPCAQLPIKGAVEMLLL